ncbi:molybdopterin-binding protein [Loktanella sp. Alg231-35]|uniref:molybdopterin-binding protein n=1 Tax=Loktanella sp. Alg231-35 TaxID=1922220 RepID=UPI000D54F58E|nr:molybdopterin-binding protein [Loktanella sp. Alg231-35]
MKFGPVPVKAAVGAVLAYAVPVATGRLRKGHVLRADDIAALHDAGLQEVMVARYDPGDLDEDIAAARLASALAGPGLLVSNAATGRVNLFAEGPGIAQINAAAINAFNGVNPMITVATVPPHHRADAGTMIATIKIISYAVPESDVATACALATGALGCRAPQFQTATLIETEIGTEPSPKGRQALQGRLDRFGVSLGPRVIVSHAEDALRAAIAKAAGEVVFVLTASATSDANDIGPAALRKAGGTLTQFGMPVDPGNLLFLGTLGERPVIGLPGCARSPALNGADWVIERVLCGVALTPEDFAQMGVGGLLKEIPTRPKPRAEI